MAYLCQQCGCTEPPLELCGNPMACPCCGDPMVEVAPEPGTAEYQALVEAGGQKRLFGEDLLD